MDNLKLPAYPFAWVEKLDKDGKPFAEISTSQFGFTKLELASLMIAQGMCAHGIFSAEECVLRAKLILHEANK